MQLGAQFYTIRDFCKDTDSLAESLKKVADIGYKTVQLSGICAYDADWMKEELRKNGLTCVLTHTPLDKIKGETDQVIKDNKTLGLDLVGIGGYYGYNNGITTIIDEFKDAVQKIKANGMRLTYHNHDHEFVKVDGKVILEHVSEFFGPDEMAFTLDTYWVQSGGADPVMWLNKLKGRTPCIHLKDCGYGPTMLPIGEGNINFDRVFAAAEAAGTEFMLVEQDNCNGEDPFDCLKRSYDYLHACGF